ncbi:MAG: methionyl-tRNA formyltransferase [Deltaproteobacteria bacterium]|jgi:methionyl-tRNA formyltransferase|nr:methionyl-tRNA formyltransferase [Deltaproteobacteria bacterium]
MSGPSAPLRIAFFGSGAFAVPPLKALLDAQANVVLVVTSPPAKSGRGRKLSETSVASLARERDLSILEAAQVNDHENLEIIEKSQPEILVVVAFRGFLGQKLISLGYTPPINIHPSLLPRHRGPAPVNWTLIHGDQECGVSVCFVTLKIDSGNVLARRSLPTPRGVGAGELEARLSEIGAQMLLEVVESVKQDALKPEAQDESSATMNRLLTKADGLVDFGLPAGRLASLINGVDPWPGAQARLNGKTVKLARALAVVGPGRAAPGEIVGLDDQGLLLVGAGDGLVKIGLLQVEGGARLPAAEFLRGRRAGKFESLA